MSKGGIAEVAFVKLSTPSSRTLANDVHRIRTRPSRALARGDTRQTMHQVSSYPTPLTRQTRRVAECFSSKSSDMSTKLTLESILEAKSTGRPCGTIPIESVSSRVGRTRFWESNRAFSRTSTRRRSRYSRASVAAPAASEGGAGSMFGVGETLKHSTRMLGQRCAKVSETSFNSLWTPHTTDASTTQLSRYLLPALEQLRSST